MALRTAYGPSAKRIRFSGLSLHFMCKFYSNLLYCSLSRIQAPSRCVSKKPATSHQLHHSPYVYTSPRTLPTLHHRFRSKQYNRPQQILSIHTDYTSVSIVVTVRRVTSPNETKHGLSKMVGQT
jgi:hypothetical protein